MHLSKSERFQLSATTSSLALAGLALNWSHRSWLVECEGAGTDIVSPRCTASQLSTSRIPDEQLADAGAQRGVQEAAAADGEQDSSCGRLRYQGTFANRQQDDSLATQARDAERATDWTDERGFGTASEFPVCHNRAILTGTIVLIAQPVLHSVTESYWIGATARAKGAASACSSLAISPSCGCAHRVAD